MAEIDPQQLNSLFVRLHRSLLQYVGECWPWSDEVSEEDKHARHVLTQSLASQRRSADQLANALEQIGWVISFGGYPTAFTDLQYLSLKYLLKQVVISQMEIVKSFDKATSVYPDSPLLKHIADSERSILQAVQNLSGPKLAVATVS
ncbi:MAG: hypothetical protein JWM11_7860 [Planctomycetaceae bacterium]|nr:hypothetical protein [Planctomycetaceae bacterium]